MKTSCAMQLRQNYRPRRAVPGWVRAVLRWL
jgi:hypothetical protein